MANTNHPIVQQNPKQNLRNSGQYGLGFSEYPPFSAGLQIATSFSKDPDIESALPHPTEFTSVTMIGPSESCTVWATTRFLVAAEMDDFKVQAGTCLRLRTLIPRR
ncbi:hypothetical protein I7I51_02176 [Histoplasma capsulatum]|uniref:Uncharacterized protein n=1 Tax=Ajellomyces capsulatus TaxID=5037 RepID=A0A8A1M8Z4_AJECA|nr:hypothetical protein I7I51_02176 [Histoplasma capsulatum]